MTNTPSPNVPAYIIPPPAWALPPALPQVAPQIAPEAPSWPFFEEIVDEPAFDRWCATVALRYGHLPPEERAELGFRDLAAIGNQVWNQVDADGRRSALARVNYICRRMEEAWEAYRVNALRMTPQRVFQLYGNEEVR